MVNTMNGISLAYTRARTCESLAFTLFTLIINGEIGRNIKGLCGERLGFEVFTRCPRAFTGCYTK
jgi:hypothetical protein